MSNVLKRVIAASVLAACVAPVAFASGEMPVASAAPVAENNPYVFVALQGGYGWQHWKDLFHGQSLLATDSLGHVIGSTLDNADDEGGIAGRASLGYGFNQYFSLEAGYSYYFNKPELKGKDFFVVNGVQQSAVFCTKVKTQIVDAFFKVKAPVVDNFELFAKAGADYMMNHFDSGDSNHNEFGPAFGVGGVYNFTPNWSVDLSWTRYIGRTKIDDKWQPNIDFFALGLMYKFNI